MTVADLVTGRNVLVAGGLGFIGSNLAIRLVQSGADVTLVDSLDPRLGGNRFNIEPIQAAVKVHIADLCHASPDEFVRGQDFVFNLAGQCSHTESMRNPAVDLAVNSLSALNLLEACRRINPAAKVVFTSTRQVYGKPQSLPVNEDHPINPIDVNGIHKLAAEQYHLLYHRVYGIPAVVLRLTNTFGPRHRISTPHSGFAGFFIFQALRGETIRVFGSGQQRRDFNYVDDVVDALLLAATSEKATGQVLNLGSHVAYSLIEFVEALREFADLRVEKVPFPAESKVIDIGDYCGDFSRLHEATGWQPGIDLRQGLDRTFEFYRRHPAPYGL